MQFFIFLFTFLGIILLCVFGGCVGQIFTNEFDDAGSKYGVLYNANTGTYSDPYIRGKWSEHQRYITSRWKWILAAVLCLFGSMTFFYLVSYIYNLIH